MFFRVAGALTLFTLAFGILITSIAQASSIEYNFIQAPSGSIIPEQIEVPYYLPYSGNIMPDHPVWPLKALRDKMWVNLTFDPVKKAQILLLIADKRLACASHLFKGGKGDLGASVLTKAEKYLEEAVKYERIAKAQARDTAPILRELSLASLKHRQVIDEILGVAPEDAKPMIVETQNYPKRFYNELTTRLYQLGVAAPTSPFNN